MSIVPERRHYVAVFLVSLALLVLEISMARILTVALVSHYAFVAISLAMFGLGLSGLAIYLAPSRFPASRIDDQLPLFASLFGGAAAVSLFIFLHIQVLQEVSRYGYLSLAVAYTVLAVPYFLGGLCISLAMTHFSSRIGSVYFADLAGASAGCLVVVAALQCMPAPLAVLACAFVVTVAASVFSRGRPRAALAHVVTAATAAMLVGGLATDAFTMRYVKTRDQFYSRTELWNAFSRVAAFDLPSNAAQILPMKEEADRYADGPYPPTMMLDIDGAAWTPMMGWDGRPESVQFLRDSVLYAGHHLKPGARTLVIGTGGGRDLVAAIAFGQPSILGLEINPLMRRMVEEEYGDWTGHPYTHPGVEVIVDEARSRLTSTDDTFDLIQLSLIDTFSLNSSGGVVFSENYLYTTEGFDEYFDHLAPDGVLSLTRYFVPNYPMEVLRLVSMARDAWERRGVTGFASHLLVLKQNLNATMLVKKTPWTQAELEKARALAADIKADILYAPGFTGGHPDLTALATTPDWRGYCDRHAYHIDPPTDDAPFFFDFLRHEMPVAEDDPFHFLQAWNDALKLMHRLIGVVTLIATLFFAAPLLLLARPGERRVRAAVAAPLLLYFACLGYGFLMIEIPLLQRFVLFLGYPVYALAVVLFSLLLFSGLGSLTVGWSDSPPLGRLVRAVGGIVVLSAAYVHGVPWVISGFLGADIAVRVAITVALLAPLGLLLGMAYPLGISVLREHGEELVPWAWGLNGVMSVVASVAAVFIGSRIGFTAAFLTGVAAYALALASMLLATRIARS